MVLSKNEKIDITPLIALYIFYLITFL